MKGKKEDSFFFCIVTLCVNLVHLSWILTYNRFYDIGRDPSLKGTYKKETNIWVIYEFQFDAIEDFHLESIDSKLNSHTPHLDS